MRVILMSKYSSKKYSENKVRDRGYQLKYKFGITIDDYNRMLTDQGGKCAICNGDNYVRKKGTNSGEEVCMSLSVDHDHQTGKVRGLLCNACNTALGKLIDDPALFKKTIEYLENKNAVPI
mgnify:CR=1 FL=1